MNTGQDQPENGADAGGTSFASNVQGSTVAAQAQGPGAKAVGIVNQYGLGYADVREIADERVAMALDRLREGVGLAQGRSMEDMLRVSFAVVQSLVASKRGAEPDAASVAEFLREAVEDPAFPARAARLFQEGAKTPSSARREMLARALFGIPATTPERDRIDAAIERLFPGDVLLLQTMHTLATQEGLDYLYVEKPKGGRVTYAVFFLGPGSLRKRPFECDDWALYSLQSAACVSFGAPLGSFNQREEYARVNITPLGRAVLKTLADIAPGPIQHGGER